MYEEHAHRHIAPIASTISFSMIINEGPLSQGILNSHRI